MSSALGAEGGAMQRWVGLMLWLLPLAWVPAVTADLYASEVKLVTQIGPRLQLSHAGRPSNSNTYHRSPSILIHLDRSLCHSVSVLAVRVRFNMLSNIA